MDHDTLIFYHLNFQERKILNCSPAGKLTFKEFYNSLKNTLELKDLPDDDFEEE